MKSVIEQVITTIITGKNAKSYLMNGGILLYAFASYLLYKEEILYAVLCAVFAAVLIELREKSKKVK